VTGATLARPELTGRVVASPGRRALRRFLRNRLAVAGLVYLLAVTAAVVLAPLLTPYPPDRIELGARLTPASAAHPLGTDESGRDVLSRLLYGGRITLAVGLTSMAVAMVVGTVLGAVSGFLGGASDALIMRFTDGMLSIPLFFLLLTVLAVFGPQIPILVLAIGLVSWMPTARVVRSEVIRCISLEFVLAARALGAPEARILARHVLPQAVPSMIVASSLNVAQVILTESSLSYLGLGVQPPTPSWGNMLSGAQNFIWSAPTLALWPGLLILLTVLSFNAVGDGLRDALDPRSGEL
jgi:peptide/nickel transport system permease protein